MIVVVSDTSPIRALHNLGLVSLLKELFGQILVPPGVRDELLSPPDQLQGMDVESYAFIEVRRPGDYSHVESLLQLLDLGESEALALAAELHADAVLVDEEDARRIATERGFTVIGTLGVLLQAKANGHIAAIRPLVGKLKGQFGFFVSAELEGHVLQLAGE